MWSRTVPLMDPDQRVKIRAPPCNGTAARGWSQDLERGESIQSPSTVGNRHARGLCPTPGRSVTPLGTQSLA